MSAIFTKGVETERGGGGGGGGRGVKKDKLFHNNYRKHSPSDSPGGPADPLSGLAWRPARGWRARRVPGPTQPGATATAGGWVDLYKQRQLSSKGYVRACGFCGAGESAEWHECFLTPWPQHPVARPPRERLACKLREHDSCKVISSRTAWLAGPPHPAGGRQHTPPPLSPLPRASPARGAQSWGAVRAMFRS